MKIRERHYGNRRVLKHINLSRALAVLGLSISALVVVAAMRHATSRAFDTATKLPSVLQQNITVRPVVLPNIGLKQPVAAPATPQAQQTPMAQGQSSLRTTPPSAPVQPAPPAFGVSYTTTQASTVCSDGSDIVYIWQATLGLTNGNGGTVKYELESQGITTGAEGYTETVTIPNGTYYKVIAAPSQPGPLYSLILPTPHPAYKLRIHVTSPNNIGSAWITGPERIAGTPCIAG